MTGNNIVLVERPTGVKNNIFVLWFKNEMQPK